MAIFGGMGVGSITASTGLGQYPVCPSPHLEVRTDCYVVLNLDKIKMTYKGVVVKQGEKEVVIPIDELASKVGLEW